MSESLEPELRHEDDYLTVSETAGELKVCTMTVYKLIWEGRLKTNRLKPRAPHRIDPLDVQMLKLGKIHGE